MEQVAQPRKRSACHAAFVHAASVRTPPHLKCPPASRTAIVLWHHHRHDGPPWFLCTAALLWESACCTPPLLAVPAPTARAKARSTTRRCTCLFATCPLGSVVMQAT